MELRLDMARLVAVALVGQVAEATEEPMGVVGRQVTVLAVWAAKRDIQTALRGTQADIAANHRRVDRTGDIAGRIDPSLNVW